MSIVWLRIILQSTIIILSLFRKCYYEGGFFSHESLSHTEPSPSPYIPNNPITMQTKPFLHYRHQAIPSPYSRSHPFTIKTVPSLHYHNWAIGSLSPPCHSSTIPHEAIPSLSTLSPPFTINTEPSLHHTHHALSDSAGVTMLNIPGLAGIIVFYLAILGIGVYAAWKRRDKGVNSDEVMLAGRSIGSFVGVLTMTGEWRVAINRRRKEVRICRFVRSGVWSSLWLRPVDILNM